MKETTNIKQRRKYTRRSSFAWAIRKQWRLDRRFVFLTFAAIPIAVGLPLLESYFSKLLIERIGAGAPMAKLAALVLAFFAVFTAILLLQKYLEACTGARHYYPTGVYQNELHEFRNHTADYELTETQDFQKTFNYAWRDSSGGSCSLEFLWHDLSKALRDAFGIVTYAALLSALNPILFAAVAVTSVVSYFTTRWQAIYTEKHKHLWEKEERKATYLKHLSRQFPEAKDIKLYNLQGWLENLMRIYQDHRLFWRKRCDLRGVWASLVAGLMTLLQNGIAYFVLIGLLLGGQMGVGDFVFYFGLVGGIAGFLQGIIGDLAELNTRAEKIDYYRELYDYPMRFNHGKGCALPTGAVTVEFKNVWYRYDGAEDDTLKGIDLTISAGESLALVGLNGAGKTTLVKLLCGLYTPTKGEILVDGKPIADYNIEEYYSLISAVFQEIKVIALTMFEFVASADLTRSTARDDAVKAMQAAGIYEKIRSLPNGIDTHLMKGIYDDGVDFSGGELQKLMLARAIYKDGAILVLDEPTAALDPIAEDRLYQQYRAQTVGKTSVYISHRLASTRFCDRIVLLENGKITESGTHDELMAKNGQYAYLFGVQSKYYKEGEINA